MWDATSATLLWVRGHEVHRYSPGGADAVLELPQPVGAALPRRRGLVLNLRDGVALIDEDGAKTWLVYWAREGYAAVGAGVDPAGRLLAGTARGDDGWLARVLPNGDAKVLVGGVGVTGFDWDPGYSRLFVGSSRGVDVYGYDVSSGDVGERRSFLEVGVTGVAVEAGFVWVGVGSSVRRYTSGGVLDLVVEVPGEVGGCQFGGRDLTDLYVTAGGGVFVVPGAGVGRVGGVFAG
ncbi:SMP-30/gluconolactonase/LRE family protein [Saccharothrix violaceirubra]